MTWSQGRPRGRSPPGADGAGAERGSGVGRNTGTLEHDLFLTADGTRCFVHEGYRDSAAGLEHMVNIGPTMESLSQVCTVSGEVCGTPSAELREALESAGVTIDEPLHRFSR